MGRSRDPHPRAGPLAARRGRRALPRARRGGDPLSTPPQERVAVPFWNGLLSGLASVAIAVVAMVVALVLLLFGVILVTGRMPSLNPGHPLLAATEAFAYAAAGSFAWWRLRAIGREPFRALTRRDVRAILFALGALLLARLATGIAMVLTHQTKHVQSGFEHFDVVTRVPAITLAAIAVGVLSMVLLAPIVEEIIFRGLLFGALAPRLGVLASALVTALLFGAVHGDLVLFPLLAALGLINAIAYAATGNLWVPIVVHGLNNALGAVALIATSLQRH